MPKTAAKKKASDKDASSASSTSSKALKPMKIQRPGKSTQDRYGRTYYSAMEDVEYPDLIEVQLNSYKWFLSEGIDELFQEISPIVDFSGKKMELQFLSHTFEDPKYSPYEAKRKNISFESALKVHVRLINKESGEIKEQDVYLGNIPLMTDKGTFVVNGIERVVVNQLVRSPGVFFSRNNDVPKYFNAKIIPKRGVWLEIETDKKGVIQVKIDRRRKVPLTSLLRVFGYPEDKDIIKLFADISKIGTDEDFILNTLAKDPSKTVDQAYQAIYKKLRPGDLATAENAKQLIDGIFFDFKKYDMSTIARYKLNKRFGTNTPFDIKHRVFQVQDLIHIVRHLLKLNNGDGQPDDIDHLSNRRVRSVGELVQNKFRIGLLRTERIVKDRMTVLELETVTPTQLVNSRPITAVMREFFASSQLSQFMDQTNPLSELAHKRRLSAMGPGGLSRERASFDVRDVHASHYGRICPIATPEGPNIGLVVHLATYAKVNPYGFIETPFRTVSQNLDINSPNLEGRILRQDVLDKKEDVVAKDGEMIDSKVISKLKKAGITQVPTRAFLTDEVKYYDADEEAHHVIAQANSTMNEMGEFVEKRVPARQDVEPLLAHVNDLTHIDVSPKQIISVSTALIPFLEHDDNTRASMGTNMQRQAVPLLRPKAPIVGTGMEGLAARSSGHCITAKADGVVEYADGKEIRVVYNNGEKVKYPLMNFVRSNQATCMNMRPIVSAKDKIKKGDPLADGASVDHGELALGQNLLVAYMSWRGYNFEDAIIISDRVFRDGDYDSIHIEAFTTDVRDTKLGPEIVTRDIPNVGEEKLKDLDADGVVRIGASIKEGDILVGKITPKGETELTPEERLLQAIFGDKAKDVKDTSLRLPGGEGGKVVDIQVFTRKAGDELAQGVIKQIKVYVAQTRKVQVGDKMAGRHGNKGVISKIVPMEDMPYLPDGTPVDIILNPLGVSSRMNIGQVLETHLGWAAHKLGMTIATPALNGVSVDQIEELLKEADLPEDGKIQLYDGTTGEPFDHRTAVGMVYMMKLSHLVEDKIHARSVGPYSLVTQQPLGGKAQHGGQRFGEMEVWALEAYGAAHILQEILTIKSDDVYGRSKAYEAIVKGEDIHPPSTPESFNVLVRELQALGLNVELLDTKSGEQLAVDEVIEKEEEDVIDIDAITELKDVSPETEIEGVSSESVEELADIEEEREEYEEAEIAS
jgi:DNA-directed RNA polymerase subunit beta